MPMLIMKDNEWKRISDPKVFTQGQMRPVKKAYIYHDAEWRLVFNKTPSTTIHCDETIGYCYHGTVLSQDFISGDQLAFNVGLTKGVAHHSDSPWIKVVDSSTNKALYFPQLTLRHTLSWKDLYEAGIVYGTDDFGTHPPEGVTVLQNKKVIIGNKEYRVSLFKGANGNGTVSSFSDADHSGTHQSEWNQLMYRLSAPSLPNPASNPYGVWETWSNETLGLVGNGTGTLCQEQGYDVINRIIRGSFVITNHTYNELTHSSNFNGWRPVLREV